MPFQQKIAYKGLILVTVPIVFEIAYIGLLSAWLHQSELAIAKQTKATATILLASRLTRLVNESSQVVSRSTPGDATASKQLSAINQEFAVEIRQLHALIATTGDGDTQLQDLEKDVRAAEAVLGQIDLPGNRTDRNQLNQACRQLRTIANQIDQNIFLSIDRQSAESSDLLTRARQTVISYIGWGLILNIILAIVLFIFFARSITRRVVHISRNAVGLSENRKLEPPIGGSDEIAQLDRVFHNMAKSLIEAKELEKAFTDYAADIIFSLDRSSNVLRVNQAVQKKWGYQPQELTGRPLYSLVPPADAEKTRNLIRKFSEGQMTEPVEIVIRRKDGVLRDMLLSMNWSKNRETLFCVAHDVSDRKRLDRLKQDLLAMISHDIRSPLTTLSLLFESFDDGEYGPVNELGKQRLSVSSALVRQMTLMTNDLLEMEKLESSELVINKVETRVVDLFLQCIRAAQPKADRREIALAVSGNNDQLTVDCDVQRISRVLMNLIDNALKFSSAGSTVTLSATELADAVEISVADSGRGIPEDKLETIFERFKQVTRSDETVLGGSGLGLAICRSIIQSHKGNIGVESETGKGSRFWFTLPK